MPFVVAVGALVAGQVRAVVAGFESTEFQDGHLFPWRRPALERPFRGLDCIGSNCVQMVWRGDARDTNLDTRKDPSGNP